MSSLLKPTHAARGELYATRFLIIVIGPFLFAVCTFCFFCMFELRAIIEPALSNPLFKEVDFTSTIVISWVFTGIFAALACVVAFGTVVALIRITPENTES